MPFHELSSSSALHHEPRPMTAQHSAHSAARTQALLCSSSSCKISSCACVCVFSGATAWSDVGTGTLEGGGVVLRGCDPCVCFVCGKEAWLRDDRDHRTRVMPASGGCVRACLVVWCCLFVGARPRDVRPLPACLCLLFLSPSVPVPVLQAAPHTMRAGGSLNV